jgi:hypothetical protein
MKRVVCATALALLIISSGQASAAPQSPGPSCPLSALERQLVEEIVVKVLNDTIWVAQSAHGSERGFALSLVGVDAAHIGAVTRIGPCEKAKSFVPYCERDFELPLVRCSRLACEAANVDTVEVSVSGGRPKYKQRTALQYATTAIPGSVVYNPFPSVVWRTVEVEPGTYAISSNVFRRTIFTPAGASALDLTHSGSIAVKVVGGEITSVEIDLAFPMLVPGEPQLVVDLSFDAAGDGSGAIRRGNELLATLSGHEAVTIAWTGPCAE